MFIGSLSEKNLAEIGQKLAQLVVIDLFFLNSHERVESISTDRT